MRYFKGRPVPFIAAWSSELDFHPGRNYRVMLNHAFNQEGYTTWVGYDKETPHDRDAAGVLWARQVASPGMGVPHFGKVHSARQRKAMNKFLCQVCGGPADSTSAGWLWVLLTAETDRIARYGNTTTTNPPVCRACVPLAREGCPAVRRAHTVVRAAQVSAWGVIGTIPTGPDGPLSSFAYTDAEVRQVLAMQQVVTLEAVTPVTEAEIADTAAGPGPAADHTLRWPAADMHALAPHGTGAQPYALER